MERMVRYISTFVQLLEISFDLLYFLASLLTIYMLPHAEQ